LIAWATTMNPFIYQAARKLFADTQPFDDGTYTDEAARIAHAIGRRLGAPRPAGTHPFVYPRLAPDVKFSAEERLRIAAAAQRRRLTLLSQLGVDETQGDRLLIITRIPLTPSTTRSR
jgi:hypothetical protein